MHSQVSVNGLTVENKNGRIFINGKELKNPENPGAGFLDDGYRYHAFHIVLFTILGGALGWLLATAIGC